MGVTSRSKTTEKASLVRSRRRAGIAAVKQLTKSEITAKAIQLLTIAGYICWRQNNTRTRKGYVFTGRKGVCDIPGFNRFNARFLACEVKTTNDRLSPEQIVFLTEVSEANGVALIATQSLSGAVILIDFKEFIKKKPAT